MAEPIDVAALHPAVPAAERLRVLEQMRDQGLISAAEYEALRAEILDEL
jgi:membrane peptidoglycan carboxypeptidase